MENHEENIVVDGRPQTVMAVLDQFSTSAEGIEKFAHLVITEVDEGREDPLKVALFMKTMEKIVERVNSRLAPHYLSEATKYGEKPFSIRGAEISIGEVGVKYDYSQCNHPAWNDLTKIIDQALVQRKEVETLLKALKNKEVFVIEGEAVEVTPPVKSGKTGIKISIR